MRITFYKECNLWYADIPEYIAQGGTKDDCQMVAGADLLLDRLLIKSKGTDRVTLEILDNEKGDCQLIKSYESYGWAYYMATIFFEEEAVEYNVVAGICPVGAWVFGGNHPDVIQARLVVNTN